MPWPFRHRRQERGPQRRDSQRDSSSGSRSRARIVHQPRIVMLDEPTAGLDPESARAVRELIVAMRSEGRAVLLCTHNLDEVERVADRVAVLRSRLVAVGTPSAAPATAVHAAPSDSAD